MALVPPVVVVEIPDRFVEALTRFLAAGHSGKIEVDVANGKITGYRMTESVRLKNT